jgi:hypothetical protein
MERERVDVRVVKDGGGIKPPVEWGLRTRGLWSGRSGAGL